MKMIYKSTMITALVSFSLVITSGFDVNAGEGEDNPNMEVEMEKTDKDTAVSNLPENSLYRMEVKTLADESVHLSKYSGKVALVVNVALQE